MTVKYSFELRFISDKKKSANYTYSVYTCIDVPKNMCADSSNLNADATEFTVTRALEDFSFLSKQLFSECPWLILPPLPDKKMKSFFNSLSGRQCSELAQFYTRALTRYLTRLFEHHYAANKQIAQQFIRSNSSEWSSLVKSRREKLSSDKILKFNRMDLSTATPELSSIEDAASRVKPVTKNFFRKLHSYAKKSVKMDIFSRGGPSSEAMPASTAPRRLWADVKAHLSQLRATLRALQRRLGQLIERRRLSLRCLPGLSAALGAAAAVEAEMERTHRAWDIAGPDPVPPTVQVSAHIAHLAAIFQQQSDQEAHKVAETLMFYHGYCLAIKKSIKVLMNAHLHLHREREELCTANESIQKATGKEGSKLKALKEKAAAHESNSKNIAAYIEYFEALFFEEFQQFHKYKQRDIHAMMVTFVSIEQETYLKSHTLWKDSTKNINLGT